MELKVGKNLFISNFKKLPKGFLIALLLIFVFELVNITFDNYFYSPQWSSFGKLRIKIKNEISQSKENNFDILILGDSHSHNGFIPRIVEEKTGLSCFNFSFSSIEKIIGYYLIFDDYLKSHPLKPRYVIIGFIPFTTYPATKSHYSKEAINYLANLKKGNVREFIEEFGIVQGVKFILPSLKHQGRFKDFIKNPFSFKIPNKMQIDNTIKHVYLNKGYLPHKKEYSPQWRWKEGPYDKGGIKNEYKIFFEDYDLNNFTISPFSYKYLKGILELAEKNKITPIYYVPALPPYVYNRLKKYMYMKQHDDFLNSLKKDYPDLVVLRAQHILNRDDMFLDIYHLSEKGASLLSEFLSQKINKINRNH